MKILFHPKAREEFRDLEKIVQKRFLDIFEALRDNDMIPKSRFKKLSGTKLFEARVKVQSGIYRGIGGWIRPNFIAVLFFKKKTQKTPRKELNKASRRFSEIS